MQAVSDWGCEMELSPEYDQTRVEFEDEWSRSNIEDLVN
ncbi:uncharacterized protein METZ01_LOCUS355729, partial [marine metagenome]